MDNNERFKIGWQKLQEIDAEAGEAVIASLQDISPDLANYIIEYAFGQVYARTILPNKLKELIVIASLIAKGNAPAQLKVHLHAALHTGNSILEIKEVILQLIAYCGFPHIINAMQSFKEVLTERSDRGIIDRNGTYAQRIVETDRLQLGKQKLNEIAPQQLQILKEQFLDFSPDLIKYLLEFAYADLYARPNLSPHIREMIIISALMSLGTVPEQLKFHMKAALHIAVSIDEIHELIILLNVFIGFPGSINAMILFRDILKEQNEVQSK